MKVIAEKQPDGSAGRILGVHMVGPWVTEQLGQAYLAVNWEATPAEVAQFIQPHPTLSEVFGEQKVTGTIKGNAITFGFNATIEGTAVKVTYTGTVESTTMKGKVIIGELGEGTFTGKKQ